VQGEARSGAGLVGEGRPREGHGGGRQPKGGAADAALSQVPVVGVFKFLNRPGSKE
jgi:hypothetical protein